MDLDAVGVMVIPDKEWASTVRSAGRSPGSATGQVWGCLGMCGWNGTRGQDGSQSAYLLLYATPQQTYLPMH